MKLTTVHKCPRCGYQLTIDDFEERSGDGQVKEQDDDLECPKCQLYFSFAGDLSLTVENVWWEKFENDD